MRSAATADGSGQLNTRFASDIHRLRLVRQRPERTSQNQHREQCHTKGMVTSRPGRSVPFVAAGESVARKGQSRASHGTAIVRMMNSHKYLCTQFTSEYGRGQKQPIKC